MPLRGSDRCTAEGPDLGRGGDLGPATSAPPWQPATAARRLASGVVRGRDILLTSGHRGRNPDRAGGSHRCDVVVRARGRQEQRGARRRLVRLREEDEYPTERRLC